MADFTDAKWVEAWMDTYYTHYVLLLLCFKDDTLKIYDPQERKLVDEIFPSYQEARYWLSEDEYDKIETRYTFDKPEIEKSQDIEQQVSYETELKRAEWVEVWLEFIYDPYVLLLYGFTDGKLRIYDPEEKSLVSEIFGSYDAACFWLEEDEFTKIQTRHLINDSE